MASAAGSGGGGGAGAGGLKTYFKTPEGRHKLQYEKTHSPAVVHYGHSGKTVSQVPRAPSRSGQGREGGSMRRMGDLDGSLWVGWMGNWTAGLGWDGC